MLERQGFAMSGPGDLARAAMGYARSGWPIFPLQPRGKAPLTPQGFKNATTDSSAVRAFWTRWPTANIGLAIPAGLIVVDFDSADVLARIRAQDFSLPTTVSAKTARGSHFWYSVDRPVPGRAFPEVDIKAQGGYVVVPPSIHPSGAAYRWTVPLKRVAISECPEWLLKKILRPTHTGRRSPDEWRRRVAATVPVGQRNVRLAEISGLVFRYLPADVAAELAYCWAQSKLDPPLSDREIRRTLDSIAGRELRRRQTAGPR